MAHAQKPVFVFRRNGRVHLNRQGRQFSRLLAAEVRASAVVMLDTPCSEVVWRVLATHSIRQFPFHFTSRAPPCAITYQLDSTALQDMTRAQRVKLLARPLCYCPLNWKLLARARTHAHAHTQKMRVSELSNKFTNAHYRYLVNEEVLYSR
jgi:hypothetical protein